MVVVALLVRIIIIIELAELALTLDPGSNYSMLVFLVVMSFSYPLPLELGPFLVYECLTWGFSALRGCKLKSIQGPTGTHWADNINE